MLVAPDRKAVNHLEKRREKKSTASDSSSLPVFSGCYLILLVFISLLPIFQSFVSQKVVEVCKAKAQDHEEVLRGTWI